MSHDERRFDPKHQHHLLNSERQAHWNPPQFLARFGLRPGQTVLDLLRAWLLDIAAGRVGW